MDAQSLHNHIQSSTQTRLRSEATKTGLPSAPTYRDDNAINAELYREELDYDGDGVVTLMEELDGVNNAKASSSSTGETTEPVSPSEPTTDSQKQDAENALPQAAILTAKEDRFRSFNAFSSHHASAPVPQQNRRAIVEEAKPMKDNTNAIIMLLLIAILIIALAIFGVVVIGDRGKTQEASRARSTLDDGTSDSSANDKAKKYKYDFSSIVGKWDTISETDSCIKISDESVFSWLQKCDDKTGDSFSGKASIMSGQDAIDYLNITKERAARIVGITESELDLDQTFSIVVEPDEYIVNGNKKAQKPNEIKLLLVKTKRDEITVYNYLYAELGIYAEAKEGAD